LTGAEGGLGAIADVEFGEDVGDVVLTVPSARLRRSAISLFEAPLPSRETISRSQGESGRTRASAFGPPGLHHARSKVTNPVNQGIDHQRMRICFVSPRFRSTLMA
jgi:hypothetical protein